MSDEERDLARIRAWDQYQRAKATCAAQRLKLSGYAEKFSAVAESLRARLDDLTGDEMVAMPTPIEYKRAINEYKAAVDDLKTTQSTARDLGWAGQIG